MRIRILIRSRNAESSFRILIRFRIAQFRFGIAQFRCRNAEFRFRILVRFRILIRFSKISVALFEGPKEEDQPRIGVG